MGERPRIAALRPDDDRIDTAGQVLRDLGAEPVLDPMIEIEPTGALPRRDCDVLIITSSTGVDQLRAGDWSADDVEIWSIGPSTAAALREAGYAVAVVPETHSSSGLVEALRDRGPGARVEIARSAHGSRTLPEGCDEIGAYHHETVLYRLVRPSGAGESVEALLAGDLDGVLFTSSRIVEHFLATAAEDNRREDALEALADVMVGAIGAPTEATAMDAGIAVDETASEGTFRSLASDVVDRL